MIWQPQGDHLVKRLIDWTREEIKPIAVGFGACLVTNRVAIEGRSIGYMYREEPDNEVDGGWRFFAGDEDDAYVDDPSNTSVFNVNTVANHDPAITPHLIAPFGSSFVRDSEGFKPDPLGVPVRPEDN